FALGRVLEALGRIDQALAAYFRALEFDPNHAEVSLRIAAIQLARNQPDQALSRLDQVVEVSHNTGEARELRGRAHLKLGHFTEPAPRPRPPARQLPHRADIYSPLAAAREANHKPDEARRAADQALRLAPNDAAARGLSQRLRR